MAKDTGSGSIATQMAATTATALARSHDHPFLLVGYRHGKRNGYKSGTKNPVIKVEIGSAIMALASCPGITMPIKLQVVHYPDGSGLKPRLTAIMPSSGRFEGDLFSASESLNKTDAAKIAAYLAELPTTLETGFAVWYRAQDGLPPLGAKPVIGNYSSGVELEE